MTPTAKRCLKCDIVKPLEAFWVQAAGKYGRTARCMECGRAEHREYKERVRPPSVKEARSRKQSLLSKGLKECSTCREVKSLDDFRVSGGKRQAACKICEIQRHREWKANNPEHMLQYVRRYTSRPEVAKQKSDRKKAMAAATPRWVMQITLRHGLKRRPTENPATIDDLMRKWEENNGCCAITGIRMTWRQGKVMPTSISIDRIDPDDGYSDSNIRLVCHAVNAFRGRMTDREMMGMAAAIVAANPSPDPTWNNFHHFHENALCP